MLGNNILHQHLAAGGRYSRHIGSRLNLVGDDRIAAASKPLHTVNFNGIGTCAPDVGAHRVEEVG